MVAWSGSKKWFTYFSLLFMSLMGTFMCFTSTNLFVIWLGFELKMFAVVPLLIKDQSKIYLVSKTEIGVGFYYFMVQVMGSILFSWGSILGSAKILGVLGLLMKFGFLPFFWWVPAVFSRLDWFWMFVLSTLQKVPSFFILRYTFDFDSQVMFFLCVFTLFLGVMGMYNNYFKLKKLMGWSSITKGVVLILLYMHSFLYSFMFFCFYVLVLSFCCWCFSNVENKKMCSFSELKKKEFSFFFKGVLGLFYFSGLPPFMSFWTKIYFFCVLKTKVVMQELSGSSIFSYIFSNLVYLPFSGIEWMSSLFIVLLMFLQVIVYLSVFFVFFMQLHSRLGSFVFSDLKAKIVFPFLVNFMLIFLLPVLFWVWL